MLIQQRQRSIRARSNSGSNNSSTSRSSKNNISDNKSTACYFNYKNVKKWSWQLCDQVVGSCVRYVPYDFSRIKFYFELKMFLSPSLNQIYNYNEKLYRYIITIFQVSFCFNIISFCKTHVYSLTLNEPFQTGQSLASMSGSIISRNHKIGNGLMFFLKLSFSGQK